MSARSVIGHDDGHISAEGGLLNYRPEQRKTKARQLQKLTDMIIFDFLKKVETVVTRRRRTGDAWVHVCEASECGHGRMHLRSTRRGMRESPRE